MKQWFKKLAAGIIAAVISLATIGGNSIPVFAEGTNYPANEANCSITINNISGIHTYEAYQIFSGDVYEVTQGGTTSSVLSNVTWGDSLHAGNNLKNKTLIQELQKQEVLKNTAIDHLTYSQDHDWVSSSPSEVLDAIKSAVGDPQNNAKAQAVAKAFFHTINDDSSVPTGSATNSKDDTSVTISRLKPGYYIVIDKKETQNDGKSDNEAYTSVILQVVGQETITPKSAVPTLSKKVWNPDKSGGAGWDDYTFAGTGDTIRYKLTGTLPSNFENFYTYVTYSILDSLPVGISINEDSVKVYAGTQDPSAMDIGANAAYTDITSLFDVYAGKPTEYDDEVYAGELDVNLNSSSAKDKKDLKTTDVYHFTSDTKIIVLYTAKLNKYAEAGQGNVSVPKDESSDNYDYGKGNKNVANLTYSNDPNMIYTNTADKTGHTPDVSATVFTFKFEPTKYHDEVKTGNEQSGAMFTLYKAISSGEGKYTKNETDGIVGFGVSGSDGKVTFYKAATSQNQPESGDYSTVKKADGTTYYVYKDTVEADGESTDDEEDEDEYDDGSVKGSGELKLKPGTYILSETTTPAGYNTMQDVTMTISASVSTDTGEPSLSSVTVDTDPKIKDAAGKEVSSFSAKELDVSKETEDTGIIVGNIINVPGSLLPSTGGIGTTIFYIAGGILIVGAAVLLINRKKKSTGN